MSFEELPSESTVPVLLKELLLDLNEIHIFQYKQFVGTHAFLTSEQQEQTIFQICNAQMQQCLSAILETVFCIRIGFGVNFSESAENVKVLSPTDTRFDVVHMFRSLSCDACCLPISMQMAEVYAPLRQLFANIEQEFDLLYVTLRVNDILGNTMFRIVAQNIKETAYKIKLTNEIEIGWINRYPGPQRPTVIKLCRNISEEHKLLILASTLFIICM